MVYIGAFSIKNQKTHQIKARNAPNCSAKVRRHKTCTIEWHLCKNALAIMPAVIGE
jgi:hypothetical protein